MSVKDLMGHPAFKRHLEDMEDIEKELRATLEDGEGIELARAQGGVRVIKQLRHRLDLQDFEAEGEEHEE